MIRAVIALLLLSFTVPAGAQGIDPAILRALAGTWFLAPMNGQPGCRVTLQTTTAIGGYGLSLAPECPRLLPRLGEVTAWNPHDGLHLTNAARRNVLSFHESEDASYTTSEPSPGYALLRAPETVTRLPMPREAFGAWMLKRPDGEVVCRVQLLNRPPQGGEESFAVRITAQGCQIAVTRLKLVSWRMEMLRLVLYGLDGASLRFVQTSSGFAKASEEGGRPLLMERAP